MLGTEQIELLQFESAMNIVVSKHTILMGFVCVVREITISVCNLGCVAKCSGVKMEMLWMDFFFNIYACNL
jgi:hypothetical protein